MSSPSEKCENYAVLVGQAMVNLRASRYAEAARFAERAARSGQAEACLNPRLYCLFAAAQRARGDYEKEGRALDEGLTLFPDAGELYHARAAFNLRRGRWDEGWKDYEHRPSRRALLRRFDEIEEWNGSPFRLAEEISGTSEINQETLLIFGEGGADQQLFFSRYIPEVLKLYGGQRVVFYTRPELARFFRNLGVSIVTSEQEVERENREDVERFATLIGGVGTLLVGIYWSDSRQMSGRTTLSFANFEPIFNVPGCSFTACGVHPSAPIRA